VDEIAVSIAAQLVEVRRRDASKRSEGPLPIEP
jgi:xanthine/CO dehydrogenase XdhC/CoxF family maturation factor